MNIRPDTAKRTPVRFPILDESAARVASTLAWATLMLAGCGSDSQDDAAESSETEERSSEIYGPDGTRWPTRTPECGDSPSATVSDSASLQAAISEAEAGDVIHLESGSYGGARIDDAGLRAQAETWTEENVVFCAAPGATPEFESLRLDLPNTSWAGITISETFFLDVNANRTRLTQSRFEAQGLIVIRGASDTELVEVVMLDRGQDGDRVQVFPRSFNDGPSVVPEDILMDGCWIEGTTVVTEGQHSDTIQTLGMTGAFVIRDTFIGAAGNNGTLQAGRENQPSDVEFASFEFYNVFLGGAELAGNGNVFAVGRTNIYRDVEFDKNLRIRPETADNPVLEMTGCRVEPENPKYPDGSELREAFPDNEYGVDVTVPAFIQPPWW